MTGDVNQLDSKLKPHNLRAERDRFVALAFCWADLLLELNADLAIEFAAGAVKPLTGKNPTELIGQQLTDIIAPQDRSLVRQLLGIASARGRIEDENVRLLGPAGPTSPLLFAGYNLPDLAAHYFIAMRMPASTVAVGTTQPVVRDAQTGLVDVESFSDVAAQRIRSAQAAGEQIKVTMLNFDGFAELHDRLAGGDRQGLLHTMGATLRAHSLNGDSATKIDDNRYSLIHSAGVNIADLESQISDYAKGLDPDQKGVSVASTSLAVDAQDISDQDLARGLMYTINQFRESEGNEFTIRTLSTSLSQLVEEAVSEVSTFRQMVLDGSFGVAFQPIIKITTGAIHHYEALARFPMTTRGASPYRYITFAEETGLIHDFDLAMARKVIEWLNKRPRNVDSYRVAVNISGSSVENLGYVTELHKLLQENSWVRGKLMFEITESARMTNLDAADGFIQSLRREGYHVCLDDFGAGAASFRYLSALDVDVVKLDGSAIRNAQRGPKGRAFLSALAELCRRLGVETIAEMIDDALGFEFVRECGVDYVQGYLFGKPSPRIKDFEQLPHPQLFARRRF